MAESSRTSIVEDLAIEDMPEELTPFKCRSCGKPLGPLYTSMDRRTLTRVISEQRVKLHISHSLEIAWYCDAACAETDAPQLGGQLALNCLYPANSAVTPCARCFKPVFRSLPHVAFARLAMSLTGDGDSLSATVLDDIDFAIVCLSCSGSDAAADDARRADEDTRSLEQRALERIA